MSTGGRQVASDRVPVRVGEVGRNRARQDALRVATFGRQPLVEQEVQRGLPAVDGPQHDLVADHLDDRGQLHAQVHPGQAQQAPDLQVLTGNPGARKGRRRSRLGAFQCSAPSRHFGALSLTQLDFTGANVTFPGSAIQPSLDTRFVRRTRVRISRRILPYRTFHPTRNNCDLYHWSHPRANLRHSRFLSGPSSRWFPLNYGRPSARSFPVAFATRKIVGGRPYACRQMDDAAVDAKGNRR